MDEIKIYNSIAEINKECWDILTKDNVFMSHNWLKTFELTTTLSAKPFYLTVFDEEKLVGAAVCYLDKKAEATSIDELLLGRFQKFKTFGGLSFLPAVICYPRKGFGSHLLISKEVNLKQMKIIMNKLIDSMQDIAFSNQASICFQYVMDHEVELMNLLTEREFYKTISYPLCYIDINWSSFEDYKKYVCRKHPSMKKTIPREINKNRKAGVVIKKLQNIDEHQGRLYELLVMNHKKYYKDDFTFKPDYFHLATEIFGDDAEIYIAVKDEKIIGVCGVLRKGNEGYISCIGIDHNYSRDDFTYFNIMYYEPIYNAITNGIKRLYYSNALYELKSRRGCSVDNTYLFYKPFIKSPGKNFILKRWFRLHNWWMTQKLSYIKNL